jgi:hypothetical protein
MILEIAPERALFEGKIQGLVVSVYENERPLQGLAGLMDWRFHGLISRCIREGKLSGRAGEIAYFPIKKADRVYHLIAAGAGHVPADRARGPLPPDSLKALHKNLLSLNLSSIGVSRRDFGDAEDSYFTKGLKGAPLWIAP